MNINKHITSEQVPCNTVNVYGTTEVKDRVVTNCEAKTNFMMRTPKTKMGVI